MKANILRIIHLGPSAAHKTKSPELRCGSIRHLRTLRRWYWAVDPACGQNIIVQYILYCPAGRSFAYLEAFISSGGGHITDTVGNHQVRVLVLSRADDVLAVAGLLGVNPLVVSLGNNEAGYGDSILALLLKFFAKLEPDL